MGPLLSDRLFGGGLGAGLGCGLLGCPVSPRLLPLPNRDDVLFRSKRWHTIILFFVCEHCFQQLVESKVFLTVGFALVYEPVTRIFGLLTRIFGFLKGSFSGAKALGRQKPVHPCRLRLTMRR
jgi:hypothetical protein